jgi:pimeloyl-ACP methyl ester carboxylesterase
METLYKTPEGRAAVLALYDRGLARLNLKVASRYVDTRFGRTHLLDAGPEGGPPLVVVHGANGSAWQMAEAMGCFADHHRCYFVDVPGDPNRSSERCLGKSDESLGRWMEDVLDALGLDRVAMLGMSGGGYVVLKCGAVTPARLSRAVLMVPEGLTRPRLLPFLGSVMWPLFRFRRSPTEVNARRLVAALSAVPPSEVPESAVEQTLVVMKHVQRIVTMGPLFSAKDLAGLEAPVLLVAAGRDVVFPGDRVVQGAKEVIRNLRDIVFLPEAGHTHPELVGGPVMKRLCAFLAEDG